MSLTQRHIRSSLIHTSTRDQPVYGDHQHERTQIWELEDKVPMRKSGLDLKYCNAPEVRRRQVDSAVEEEWEVAEEIPTIGPGRRGSNRRVGTSRSACQKVTRDGVYHCIMKMTNDKNMHHIRIASFTHIQGKSQVCSQSSRNQYLQLCLDFLFLERHGSIAQRDSIPLFDLGS